MIEIESVLGKYVNYFLENKKFQMNNINQINKILNSKEYGNFIDVVYNYYNSKLKSNDNYRLNPQFYIDANRTIDQFWDLLLDEELNTEFKSNLKTKLKL